MGEWMMELFAHIMFPILLCIFFSLVLACLKCIAPKYFSKLGSFFESFIVRLIETLFSTFPIFGGKSMQTLLFIPNADQHSLVRWSDYIYKSNQCNGFYEISQDALSRYLLNNETANVIDELNSGGSSKTFDNKTYEMLWYLRDFKKEAKITELEIYRCSMHWLLDSFGIYHTFIVFQTESETEGKYWWSLEKNTKYIVMQRSRNKFAVFYRLMRNDRKNVKYISENLVRGCGTMTDLLTTLWAHNITEKYHVVKASCQTFVQFIEKANHKSFVDFVLKGITSFEPAVPYFTSHTNKKFEPIINLLTKFPEWPPLFAIVYLGDPVLLENLLSKSKEYPKYTDVNLIAYDTSLLQLAILLSRTQMVEILLRYPKLDLETPHLNEDSDKPWKGMSVFHTAAAFTDDTEIIDLLFKSEKVNKDKDAMGRTALHIAAKASNKTTVGHLLQLQLMDPNARDNKGLTPLHLAARYADNTKIIDLLLAAKKKQDNDTGIDDDDSEGRTALHRAVMGLNVTTARHLIEKGANPNQTDKTVDGTTPLELAAQEAKDMKIVDLLLENETVYRELREKGGDRVFTRAIGNANAGLSNEIEYRLRSKGIARKKQIPSKTNSKASPDGPDDYLDGTQEPKPGTSLENEEGVEN